MGWQRERAIVVCRRRGSSKAVVENVRSSACLGPHNFGAGLHILTSFGLHTCVATANNSCHLEWVLRSRYL